MKAIPALLSLLCMAGVARADCISPDSAYSACFDADTLWWRANPGAFVSVDSTQPLRRGDLALGAALTYAARPLVVIAASPDPDGRELRVIRDRIGTSLLFAYAPLRRLDLNLEIPFVAFQSGSGLSGLTTRGAVPLTQTTLRDPRLGAGYSLLDPAAHPIGVKALLDFILPLGDPAHFAGGSSFRLSPAFAAEANAGPAYFGLLARARFRERALFADARFGTQLEVGLGAGVHVLDRERLSLALEGRALPVLASQSFRTPAGQDVSGVLFPAEWLLIARSSPWGDSGPVLRAGGGTSLPLSSRTVRDPDGSERTGWFAGATSPRFRLLLSAHYTFDPATL